MQKDKNDIAELNGFLFANFGASVGIDIVPFLAANQSPSIKKKMMKGRKKAYQNKNHKEKYK